MDSTLQNQIKKVYSDIESRKIRAETLIDLINNCIQITLDKETIHSFLDLAHSQTVVQTIYNADLVTEWLEKLVNLIDISQFHTGYLLEQRAKRYNKKTVFNIIRDETIHTVSYADLWKQIIETGKALSTLEKADEFPTIGLLTHNQLNSVLIDLACLSFGWRVIPIPLNSTSEHLSFILNQSEISHLFVGGKTGIQLWNKVQPIHKISVISFSDSESLNGDVISWETFFESRYDAKNFNAVQRMSYVPMNETQTIMYTSGTTANPKGITFTQMNLISKRFARGLALPEINANDCFLCYLPLFHTFGRYFELMGSIYWGATYSFAESPAFNSLLKDFQLIKPSIFISIPKRWVQLYEMLEEELDLDSAKDEKINEQLKKVTGGKLTWGLSAAGYLDPDIFLFYQSHGINILSGYGMTEATGGITMTPPDDYVKDSVGKALPGLDIKLAGDGEMLIRGKYISPGYYKEIESDAFANNWFNTGDIFKEKNGHYFIIDRKKDIYKNSRGQTIAPQKIENLFQDFDSIKSVFLVGDGKEFNTVLIYPDHENSPIDLKSAENQKIRDLFSSMILSVNSFLSPFERIVNFVIIPRDFSKEKNELTQKGTYNRRNILKNFSKIIEPLYEKNYVALYSGAKEVRIPNWLLREIGIVRSNLNWDGQNVIIHGQPEKLLLSWAGKKIQLGDFIYSIQSDIFDFESFIKSPSHWLGNFSFTNFVGPSIFRLKETELYSIIQIDLSIMNSGLEPVTGTNPETTVLLQIHHTVRNYLAGDPSSLKMLTKIVDGHSRNWQDVILETFLIYKLHPESSFQIRLIEALTPLLSGDFLVSMIKSAYYYQRDHDPKKRFTFNINRAADEHYQSFIKYLQDVHQNIIELNSNELEFVQTILLLVADFGTLHPTRYVWARSELVWWQISQVPKPLFSTAQKAYYTLTKGFRSWIGKSASLTIDRETGKEYTWEDVITFDENVKISHQKQLITALRETSLIRESIFLFSSNFIIGLNDISPDGIWITHLGTRNNKSVFRILVKTRSMGNHNLVVNLNEGWNRQFLEEEIKWLIIMGSGFKDEPLVENFGGYWPEFELYTEEYIHGETVAEYLGRNRNDIGDDTKIDRWQMRWLHFIWNGIQAYQEFWGRTEFKLSIQPPSTENLIIPKHDYTTGTRLISISSRKQIESISEHFLSLFIDYIVKTEEKFEGLKHMSNWEVIFTATLQAVKVSKGKKLLFQLKSELGQRTVRKKLNAVGCTTDRIDRFLKDIQKFGVLTKPVVFASLRYDRWLELNPEATLSARASILQELYKDYNLDILLDEYPETRVRFFMMTCFKRENPKLMGAFQDMIEAMRKKELNPWNLQDRIAKIQSNIQMTEEEKFFLARMLFPHVDSADYVELVTTTHGEDDRLNLLFQTEGKDGQIYRIRPPFLPKEIAQFHTLLSESSLSGIFTAKHEFLFVFNARNRLVGGLFWKNLEQDRIHLEWVIVREKYRKISLSKRLMDDFYKRMEYRGIQIITVGFYVEKFFFRHGFKINKQYGGLVKIL
ncbi:MAG: hypothetical protein CMG57_07050 [Candidatus Marinimicrobia bacterium]|nr:hypothetical protein [Candidatus Neomarinimicrobiota bacterium]